MKRHLLTLQQIEMLIGYCLTFGSVVLITYTLSSNQQLLIEEFFRFAEAILGIYMVISIMRLWRLIPPDVLISIIFVSALIFDFSITTLTILKGLYVFSNPAYDCYIINLAFHLTIIIAYTMQHAGLKWLRSWDKKKLK